MSRPNLFRLSVRNPLVPAGESACVRPPEPRVSETMQVRDSVGSIRQQLFRVKVIRVLAAVSRISSWLPVVCIATLPSPSSGPGVETDLSAISVWAQRLWDKESPISPEDTVLWERPYASIGVPLRPSQAPPGLEEFPIGTEPNLAKADRNHSATKQAVAYGQTNIKPKAPPPTGGPDEGSNWKTGLPEEGGLDSAALVEM